MTGYEGVTPPENIVCDHSICKTSTQWLSEVKRKYGKIEWPLFESLFQEQFKHVTYIHRIRIGQIEEKMVDLEKRTIEKRAEITKSKNTNLQKAIERLLLEFFEKFEAIATLNH